MVKLYIGVHLKPQKVKRLRKVYPTRGRFILKEIILKILKDLFLSKYNGKQIAYRV